jgi:hypothetical protein
VLRHLLVKILVRWTSSHELAMKKPDNLTEDEATHEGRLMAPNIHPENVRTEIEDEFEILSVRRKSLCIALGLPVAIATFSCPARRTFGEVFRGLLAKGRLTEASGYWPVVSGVPGSSLSCSSILRRSSAGIGLGFERTGA